MAVHIGSRFTGKPQVHIDTTTGVYWESLPKIEGCALDVQQALTKKPSPPRRTLLQQLVGTGKLPSTKEKYVD